MKYMIAIALVLLLPACGRGRGGPNSPTPSPSPSPNPIPSPSPAPLPSPSPSPTPTPAPIPNVAGTYNGNLEFRIGGGSGPPVILVTQMVVVQVGAQVTITGTWTLAGVTNAFGATTGTVNATGFYTPASPVGGSSFDPTCGTVRVLDVSYTFVGNTLQYVEHDSTQNCGNWAITGTLTR